MTDIKKKPANKDDVLVEQPVIKEAGETLSSEIAQLINSKSIPTNIFLSLNMNEKNVYIRGDNSRIERYPENALGSNPVKIVLDSGERILVKVLDDLTNATVQGSPILKFRYNVDVVPIHFLNEGWSLIITNNSKSRIELTDGTIIASKFYK